MPSTEQAFVVCNAYLNHRLSFQRGFFSGLSSFSESSLTLALGRLNSAGLLTGASREANFNAVARHQDPLGVANALNVLDYAGLLTGASGEANRHVVAEHQDPLGVANALNWLNDDGLLIGASGEANRHAVAGHLDSSGVARALSILRRAGLLAGASEEANRHAVAGHLNPSGVARALDLFHSAGLLRGVFAQGVFDMVVVTHSAILGAGDIAVYGSQIPEHRLTQARFDAMIAICQAHHENVAAGRARLIDYIHRELLDVMEEAQARRERVFNAAQSTHTESVHETVSASALSLMKTYGALIRSESSLNAQIAALSQWIRAIKQPSLKEAAAIRCLERITARNYFFTDHTSQVSTKQLLALGWLAIHDDKKRQGTLVDAKVLLIAGLYEIQRGYNLSETGVDAQQEMDRLICIAGTFNKLMEKLSGVHPDVEVKYITPEGAALKFPILVREVALDYLAKQVTAEESAALLARIVGDDEGLDVIWDKISDKVREQLFDEFGRLYPEGREGVEFTAFLSQGVYVALGEDFIAAVQKARTAPASNLSHPSAFFQPATQNLTASAEPAINLKGGV